MFYHYQLIVYHLSDALDVPEYLNVDHLSIVPLRGALKWIIHRWQRGLPLITYTPRGEGGGGILYTSAAYYKQKGGRGSRYHVNMRT